MIGVNKKVREFVEVVRDIVIIVCIFFSLYTVVQMTIKAKHDLAAMEKRIEIPKKTT